MKFISATPVEEVNINLTPLIDVVFLLLIFFMVSTTFDTTSQLKIKLPEASQDEAIKPKQPLYLVINIEGKFFLNTRELSSQKSEALSLALQRILDGSDRPIVIQSDAESPVQSLVTAMDVVARLGLTQVSIATTRPLE
ncbi:MAG: biopolymer transporter ExbD [Gammaproteobacteria bacterium]|nr:MAG: biopolymer transporter ExbD [Gammaproteobacteria bacterium]